MSGGKLVSLDWINEKSQIFSTLDFAKFALVSVEGVNLVRQEYFVSQIGWLETKLSKTIRLKVGKRKSIVLLISQGDRNQILFSYFPPLCGKK